MRESTIVLFNVLRRIEDKLVCFETKLEECHKLIEELTVNGIQIHVAAEDDSTESET